MLFSGRSAARILRNVGFIIHLPRLLIWEECYYEPKSRAVLPHSSGIEKPELPFGDWEGYWATDAHSQLRLQTGNRLQVLIDKMMMNNQVNLVGQGIVGRAAFTGNHEWILAKNYIGDAHPPEVLGEIRDQFSGGMKTIAVIPTPHGVVQLGSSLTIMENMGFVNNVKSLILQLGCVPGALLSENLVKESTERIGVPVSFGMPDCMSVHFSRNKVLKSTHLAANSGNQACVSSLSSTIAQPSHSQVRQIQDNLQSTASTFCTLNLKSTLPRSHGTRCEQKMTSNMPPGNPFRDQLEDRVFEAEVIPSNFDAWLNKQPSSYNSSPFSHQSVVGQSVVNNSILTLLEQQVLSDTGPQILVNGNKNALDSSFTPLMRTNESLIVNSHGGPLTLGTELHNGVSSQMRATSVPCSLSHPDKSLEINQSSIQLVGFDLQNSYLSRVEEVPSSCLVDQSTVTGTFAGVSHQRYHSTDAKHAKNGLVAKNEKKDDDLFQALIMLSSQQDEHKSLDENFPGSFNYWPMHAGESQSIDIASLKHEDPCGQPLHGDDLYDVLGADFKSRLFNSKSDSLLVDGPSTNSQGDKDILCFTNVQETSSDLFSANQGISDCSLFTGMGSDHLLDAVVSRAHSAAKQSSDDNGSCKTTSTKISGSSVPSGSPTYGLVDMSDNVLKDLPDCLEKAGIKASSSLGSGCIKDDTGSCSQTTSIYGSQLSSWVGQTMRRDNSVSTAYFKKNDETSKPNRKRLKPGENPRPRPKDRQMIQDRVKELREIVPNGSKCSIDALLERTIKHMLFLQSVTKHADKLKQTGESKIISKEGGVLLKDNFEGGATWAFEVGSQSMVCPIIVEDLNSPRQMLVEMLCEERGLFLEIADLIRGLGLTILKGVMEARNDKIWARFAVEANRDVTRMEVFMSLVHLLEQTVKGGSSSTSATLENNMMVHHAFSQATSIPATGRPCSLQRIEC
ncbi:transcription factor LHW isoform X2 [Euphorbia lathyris]|uniref:transcription factor LHW isoform X2 n=1 Tax=Euphorbia lathyris TaxID=212925 RepID=UPI0033131005